MSPKMLLLVAGVVVLLWLVSEINVNATITTGEPTITYRSNGG
jgi:hypothetical protein